jgi:hypothetical protein
LPTAKDIKPLPWDRAILKTNPEELFIAGDFGSIVQLHFTTCPSLNLNHTIVSKAPSQANQEKLRLARSVSMRTSELHQARK